MQAHSGRHHLLLAANNAGQHFVGTFLSLTGPTSLNQPPEA